MSKFKKMKASKSKTLKASAGKGANNETVPEPSPADIEEPISEAAVEDTEGRGDVGDLKSFGDSSKVKVKASSQHRRQPVEESLEDEAIEGLEGEEGEEMGMPPTVHPAVSASETEEADPFASEGGSSEEGSSSSGSSSSDDSSSSSSSDGSEGEGSEDFLNTHESRRPVKVAKEAGSFGKSGKATLPKHAIGEYDETFSKPKSDDTGGAGKSYKLKTSVAGNNPLARKITMEANRSILKLEDTIKRLRESNRAKERNLNRYQGIIRVHNTKISANNLLREAVRRDKLTADMAAAMYPKLVGLDRNAQINEIKFNMRLLESTKEGVLTNFRESSGSKGEGTPGRGTAVSLFGTSDGHSGLIDQLAADGIPMKPKK